MKGMGNLLVLLLVLGASVALIYAYGGVVKTQMGGEDPFKTEFIEGSEISWWSIFHLILFTLLGYIFGGSYGWICILILIGAMWEGIEHLLSSPESRRNILGMEYREDAYWYAKISDITMDVFGLMLGVVLYRFSSMPRRDV